MPEAICTFLNFLVIRGFYMACFTLRNSTNASGISNASGIINASF